MLALSVLVLAGIMVPLALVPKTGKVIVWDSQLVLAGQRLPTVLRLAKPTFVNAVLGLKGLPP
jgi:hypothetical protein